MHSWTKAGQASHNRVVRDGFGLRRGRRWCRSASESERQQEPLHSKMARYKRRRKLVREASTPAVRWASESRSRSPRIAILPLSAFGRFLVAAVLGPFNWGHTICTYHQHDGLHPSHTEAGSLPATPHLAATRVQLGLASKIDAPWQKYLALFDPRWSSRAQGTGPMAAVQRRWLKTQTMRSRDPGPANGQD